MSDWSYNLGQIEVGAASGMDALLESEPSLVSPVKVASQPKPRMKVGSIQDLAGFHRISEETLVHKATQDLWSLVREGDDYYVARLFQDNGAPLKV